jgi:hypothetical protein
VAEENKLARDSENVAFAEERARQARQHLQNVRDLCDGVAEGENHDQAKRLLCAAEESQRLLDEFCLILRATACARRL